MTRRLALVLILLPSLAFADGAHFFLPEPSLAAANARNAAYCAAVNCQGGTIYWWPEHSLSVTTATSLTVPTGALYATVIVEGGQVRYSSTTTPTASIGMLLQPGGPYFFSIGPLSSLKFIDATGSTATLDVEYLR